MHRLKASRSRRSDGTVTETSPEIVGMDTSETSVVARRQAVLSLATSADVTPGLWYSQLEQPLSAASATARPTAFRMTGSSSSRWETLVLMVPPGPISSAANSCHPDGTRTRRLLVNVAGAARMQGVGDKSLPFPNGPVLMMRRD